MTFLSFWLSLQPEDEGNPMPLMAYVIMLAHEENPGQEPYVKVILP